LNWFITEPIAGSLDTATKLSWQLWEISGHSAAGFQLMTHAVEALGKEMTDERTELFIAQPKTKQLFHQEIGMDRWKRLVK
jgi:hypothetical protein